MGIGQLKLYLKAVRGKKLGNRSKKSRQSEWLASCFLFRLHARSSNTDSLLKVVKREREEVRNAANGLYMPSRHPMKSEAFYSMNYTYDDIFGGIFQWERK